MIHTTLQLTETSLKVRLEKVNLPKSIQHALLVLDELGLIFAIQAVKAHYRSPLHPSNTLLPLTTIQYALIGGRILWIFGKISDIQSPKLGSLISLTKELGIIYLCNLSYPYFFIHEYGHALSARALFKNANPKVLIEPFIKGGTKFSVSNGFRGIGEKKSICLVALGGLGSSLTFIIGETLLAKLIRTNCPKTAHFLKLHAIAQLTQEVFYATSFYWTSPMDRAHDLVRFCRLSKTPAYLPILTLVALPIFLYNIFTPAR